MPEFKKGDWVKLVDADCNDRKAGLANGAVGRVSGFCETGGPTIDFGGANPDRIMLSEHLALISPAEAASVGDTVTVAADSPWAPRGDRLVVRVDDRDERRDMRLLVVYGVMNLWVRNRFVTALKRKADTKIAEPRQFKVGDWVTKNTSLYGTPLTAGKIMSVNLGLGHATVKFPGWTGGSHDDAGGFRGSCWSCSLDDITLAEAPAATIEANSTPVEPEKPQAFIVVSDEGAARGSLEHDRRGSAEAEAGRLALVRPGVKFTVYQAVTVVEAPKPEVSVVFLDEAAQ
jgi:hypothetical protein